MTNLYSVLLFSTFPVTLFSSPFYPRPRYHPSHSIQPLCCLLLLFIFFLMLYSLFYISSFFFFYLLFYLRDLIFHCLFHLLILIYQFFSFLFISLSTVHHMIFFSAFSSSGFVCLTLSSLSIHYAFLSSYSKIFPSPYPPHASFCSLHLRCLPNIDFYFLRNSSIIPLYHYTLIFGILFFFPNISTSLFSPPSLFSVSLVNSHFSFYLYVINLHLHTLLFP